MPEPIKPYQEFVDKNYNPNSKLDWRPEYWLGERAESVTGPKYTEEDVRIFRSHVPEYKKIEREARKNGTWLQMPDGTTWTGDPREWVMMQSEAFKKNYQDNPWYTGQAEWATKVTLPDGTVVDTDKVKRARYHNGEMWFSNDAGYAQYFADIIDSSKLSERYHAGSYWDDTIDSRVAPESKIKGKVFLAGIPKTGNYRHLDQNHTPDYWQDMPYDLTENDIVRTSSENIQNTNDYRRGNIKISGENLKTDDLVNHSRQLGDDGLFIYNVNDGPALRKDNEKIDYKPIYTNEYPWGEDGNNARPAYTPINEFISQPGFTEKIKFIRGNNGNFDPNTDDKYSAIFKTDSPLFAKKGGRIHIKKKNRGKFTEYCGGKVTEECIAKGKKSKDPKIRKRATFAANARKWKHENGGIIKYQNPNSPLFNPHKIIENVPAREWGPRKINEDYSITEGKGTNFWRAPFQYWGNKGLGSQNEKLARDLVSEFDQMRSENPDYNYTLDKNYQSYDDAINYINHLEGLKKYLHLPYDTGLLMESKYKPTRLQGTNEKTYKFRSSMTPGYWNDVVEDMVIGEHNKNQYYDQSLNEFTAYRDRDEKGDFVSIYDEWDYNPAVRGGNKKLNKVVDSVTGGKPFVIYDRVYLDDHYDIPEEARGNPFITPAVVTANAKHENGGVLKAQEGTPYGLPGGAPSYMQVQPFSPVGIALNQAKAMAKMKGEQQHLPPGVKEVVGPDGKKVAIRTEQPLVPLEQNVAEWLPGTGDVAEVGYIADDVKNGNYGSAALTAGLMFLPGNAGKLLSKYRKTVSKTADAVEDAVRKADVSEYINTVDDALPERQPLTISKSKQFWDGTSESKLTDAEKAGVPKGERNQPVKVKTYYERDIIPLLSAEYTQRFEAPPLDPDYLETSSWQRAKYQRLMNDKFENIFDNTEDFNKTLQSYIDGLPNEIDPRFTSTTDGEIIQPSIAVRGYRNYLLNNGVDAVDISDDDLARLLTQEYKNLSNTATGKLKNTLLWHGSPTQFESFDFSKTSANTGNSGALGPGNYFSTHGGKYGHARSKIDNSLEMNNFQPYIVSNITSTPAGHDMIEKGLLPKFIDSYAMRSAKNQAILQKLISEIPTNDNRAYIDFTEAVNGYFNGPRAGIMIRRNTGIKSLYPHPSRFVRNADGTVTLIPTDWNDTRVNFKEGGKL